MNIQYLAGLIDGEGSFCIGVGKTKQNKDRSPYLDYQFKISMNLRQDDDWLLKEISQSYGGKIYSMKTANTTMWTTTNIGDALKITAQLIPYLKLKKESAIILKKAIETWLSNTHRLKKKYRVRGMKTHTQQEMLDILELSQNINNGHRKHGKRSVNIFNELVEFIKVHYPLHLSED